MTLPRRGPYIFILAVALFVSGCDKSPAEPFARLIEQAAAWAASARYAHELNASREVPDAYINDLTSTGTAELQQLRTQIAKAQDVPADDRATALSLTDDLHTLFSSGKPGDTELAALETQLRKLAEKVRQS